MIHWADRGPYSGPVWASGALMVAEVTLLIPLASPQIYFSVTQTLFGPWFICFFFSKYSAANIYFHTSCWVFSLVKYGFSLGRWQKSDRAFRMQGFVLRNQIMHLEKVNLGNAEKRGKWGRICKQHLSQSHHTGGQFLLTFDNKYHNVRSFIVPVEGLSFSLLPSPLTLWNCYTTSFILCFILPTACQLFIHNA